MSRPLVELVGCKRFTYCPSNELFVAGESYDIDDAEKRAALLASVDDKGRKYFREVVYMDDSKEGVERSTVEVRRGGRPKKVRKGGDTRELEADGRIAAKETSPIETDDGVAF